MVRFQKLTRNLFLSLHGHNAHRQQRQMSKFLMRYQQFASHAYCGAAGPVSKMASKQEKAFCVLRFEVSRSVITVQREFRAARFRKDAPWGVFSKPCTATVLLHSNHSIQTTAEYCWFRHPSGVPLRFSKDRVQLDGSQWYSYEDTLPQGVCTIRVESPNSNKDSGVWTCNVRMSEISTEEYSFPIEVRVSGIFENF
jgi:hypothetical protein